ncbi:hypothetical protein ACIPYU_05590 [Paenarthrobacter nicotinovorans]
MSHSESVTGLTTPPWDVRESLDDAGADFINNARLIRSAVVAALEG